jgi:hypothetical protein
MVKYLLVNAYVFLAFLSIAQTENKDVVITASGSGPSQELAKQTALRNAIEQAFGTFISSKTEILNDEIVADQMSSVSSGNVKSYEVLNESQLPNGTWASTLRVIVSVDKLTSFVEAKGIIVEMKGGLFALNIKQQILNEQGEINAISEMVGVLHEPMQTAFDYTIKSGNPKSLDADSKNWEIPLTVSATANKNLDFCANYFIKTLSAISLNQAEVETYKSLNKEVFTVSLKQNGIQKQFYLRKEISINVIYSLVSNWEFYLRLFSIQSGFEEINGKGNGSIKDLFGINRAYNFNNETTNLILSFPSQGELVANFYYDDKKTLNQIEQIKDYKINPRGAISKFKNGGFIIYEENGHGFVASVCDLGFFNWSDALTVCDELIINGYNDWRLPHKDELILIFKELSFSFDTELTFPLQKHIGNFHSGRPYDRNETRSYPTSSEYWSNTHEYAREDGPIWFVNFDNGEAFNNYGFRRSNFLHHVRAVRSF